MCIASQGSTLAIAQQVLKNLYHVCFFAVPTKNSVLVYLQGFKSIKVKPCCLARDNLTGQGRIVVRELKSHISPKELHTPGFECYHRAFIENDLPTVKVLRAERRVR